MTPENPKKPITLADLMAQVEAGTLPMEKIDELLAAQEAEANSSTPLVTPDATPAPLNPETTTIPSTSIEPALPVVAQSTSPLPTNIDPSVIPTLEVGSPERNSVSLGDLYAYLNKIKILQETQDVPVEYTLRRKFGLTEEAAAQLMVYLEHEAKIIDASAKIYQNVLDAAADELNKDPAKGTAKWEYLETVHTTPVSTQDMSIPTPHTQPEVEPKHSFTHGELLDFLKGNISTPITVNILMQKFSLSSEEANEVMGDIRTAKILDTNDVPDIAFIEKNEKEFGSELATEYTFTNTVTPAPAPVAAPIPSATPAPTPIATPAPTAAPISIPITVVTTPPVATPSPVASPEAFDVDLRTLDDVLDSFGFQYTIQDLVEHPKLFAYTQTLEKEIENRVHTCLYSPSKSDAVDIEKHTVEHKKLYLADAILYKELFSKNPYENDSRLTKELKEQIRKFLSKSDEIITYFRTSLAVSQGILGRLEALPEDAFNKGATVSATPVSPGPTPAPSPLTPPSPASTPAAAPAPTSTPSPSPSPSPAPTAAPTPAGAPTPIAVTAATNAAQARAGFWSNLSKKQIIIAGVFGAAVALGAVGLANKGESKDTATPTPVTAATPKDTKTPEATKPKIENTVSASPTLKDPDFRKKGWWKSLDEDTQQNIDALLNAKQSQEWLLRFYGKVVDMNNVEVQLKPEERLAIVNRLTWPNMVSNAYSKEMTTSDDCKISMNGTTCNIRENLASMVVEMKKAFEATDTMNSALLVNQMIQGKTPAQIFDWSKAQMIEIINKNN